MCVGMYVNPDGDLHEGIITKLTKDNHIVWISDGKTFVKCVHWTNWIYDLYTRIHFIGIFTLLILLVQVQGCL